MVAALDGKDVYKARPLKAKRVFGDPAQHLMRKERALFLRKTQNGGSTKKRHCAAAAAATDRSLHANRSKVNHPLLLLPPLPSSGSPCQRELRRICSAYSQWEQCPSSVTDIALWDTTKRLRHVVSSEEANPGITQAVIDAGLVPILVRLLARDHDLPTVYEAVYALVNVTYITCAVVFQQDWAVQHLGKLVASSQSPEIREHAAWCLGNMVCESSQYRDVILEDPNARQGLIQNLIKPASEGVLKTVSWVCRCIIRRSPRLPTEYEEAFVPALIDILNKCEASEVNVSMRANVVLCLAEIMSWGNKSLGNCIEAKVLEPLMALLRNQNASPDHHSLLYALRALGEIPPERPVYILRLVKMGFLECSGVLLEHESPSVQEITCLILSNICTSSKTHVRLVHSEGHAHNVTRKLIHVALHASYKTRVHASWAVNRLVKSLPSEEMRNLDAYGAVEVLAKALRMECEVELIYSSLEELYKILFICRETAVVKFEELHGEETLNDLLYHHDNEIHHLSKGLLSEFFDYESIYSSEDEDEFSCGLREHDESFSFSLPSKQLFPTDCSMEGPPETPARRFGGVVSSPNVLDMSIGETAQI